MPIMNLFGNSYSRFKGNQTLTLGENRHATVTLADKLIVTDIDVRRSGTWFPVPKYNGTKANQITHVVYIVKPAHLNW